MRSLTAKLFAYQKDLQMYLKDGVINDIDETISAIRESSKMPLSVLLIGIGPADYAIMVCITGSMITINFYILYLSS